MRYTQLAEMSRYIGDFDAYFGMKTYRFCGGRADGLQAIDLDNRKGLTMTVLIDKCLDIPYLSFHGCNVGFLSKTGLTSPVYYQEDGIRGFLKQFNGGFLTTCGLTYSGSPCTIAGRTYGLHGSIHSLPAENVNHGIVPLNGQVALQVTGSVREACVFEENMWLHRKLLLETESNVLHIHDTVENRGFRPQPLMTIYHMNYGYPMLQENAVVATSAQTVIPMDEDSEAGMANRASMELPQTGFRQQNFYHRFPANAESAYAMLYNPQLGIAVVTHFDPRQCPVLCQWKNMLAGDYVLGLEPTVNGTQGKAGAIADGSIHYLGPGQQTNFDITVEFLDDPVKIQQYLSM